MPVNPVLRPTQAWDDPEDVLLLAVRDGKYLVLKE
jgi:hypothetical protein